MSSVVKRDKEEGGRERDRKEKRDKEEGGRERGG